MLTASSLPSTTAQWWPSSHVRKVWWWVEGNVWYVLFVWNQRFLEIYFNIDTLTLISFNQMWIGLFYCSSSLVSCNLVLDISLHRSSGWFILGGWSRKVDLPILFFKHILAFSFGPKLNNTHMHACMICVDNSRPYIILGSCWSHRNQQVRSPQ